MVSASVGPPKASALRTRGGTSPLPHPPPVDYSCQTPPLPEFLYPPLPLDRQQAMLKRTQLRCLQPPSTTPIPGRAPTTRSRPYRMMKTLGSTDATGTGSIPVTSTLGGSHEPPEPDEPRDIALDHASTFHSTLSAPKASEYALSPMVTPRVRLGHHASQFRSRQSDYQARKDMLVWCVPTHPFGPGRSRPPLPRQGAPALSGVAVAGSFSHSSKAPAGEEVCHRFNAGRCHRTDCYCLHKCSITGCRGAHPASTCPHAPLQWPHELLTPPTRLSL